MHPTYTRVLTAVACVQEATYEEKKLELESLYERADERKRKMVTTQAELKQLEQKLAAMESIQNIETERVRIRTQAL